MDHLEYPQLANRYKWLPIENNQILSWVRSFRGSNSNGMSNNHAVSFVSMNRKKYVDMFAAKSREGRRSSPTQLTGLPAVKAAWPRQPPWPRFSSDSSMVALGVPWYPYTGETDGAIYAFPVLSSHSALWQTSNHPPLQALACHSYRTMSLFLNSSSTRPIQRDRFERTEAPG